MKLNASFYQNENVLEVSRALLGKYLFTNINSQLTGGMIVETEAYDGIHDKASHAWNGRYTKRTKVMYQNGGLSYVYLCYGIHHLFNVVSGMAEHPQAVLIRAIEPTVGLKTQLERRRMTELNPRITAGPGAMSKALDIDLKLNGMSLQSNKIWIEDKGISLSDKEIVRGTRVGVAYAEEHALHPWRFSIKGNPFVSKAK